MVIGAGAKVLGPITIGEGSRIGCNAVVVNDTPACSTVVGVPGHVVIKRDDKDNSAQREAMAKKIGFTAYAESKDMPDPIQNALDAVLDHMHKTDQEMEELKKKLKENE